MTTTEPQPETRRRRKAQRTESVLSTKTDNTAGEQSPYDLPGARLRTNVKKAAKGLYAPALPGAPSTTRQASILNTALIGPVTGARGVANGRDMLSRMLIAHDPVTGYNETPKTVTSPNTVVLGGVGGGKSSFVKTVCVVRPLLLRYRRAVVFDKKPRGQEGEYADVVREYGNEPLRFTTDGTGSHLNLFDPLIFGLPEDDGGGAAGVSRLIRAVVSIARDGRNLTEWESKAVRIALGSMMTGFEDRRTPTLADFLPRLGRVSDDVAEELSAAARDRLHQAGLSIRFTLDELLEDYSGLIDGETSKDVDLTGKLTSFDISQLPSEGPSSAIIRAIGNQWMLGRIRVTPGYRTTCVQEEGWDAVAGPTAHILKSNQKLSRGLGLSKVFVFHKGTDIPADSPGQAVISEAQSIYVFRQDRETDAAWCCRTFGFDPDTAPILQKLQPGHFVFKYASHPETHVEHVRSDWEIALTDTDEGMRPDDRDEDDA